MREFNFTVTSPLHLRPCQSQKPRADLTPFRVLAENAAGLGAPSEPSEYIKVCEATYPPGPPINPKVTDYSSSTVSLTWSKPIYDGGADISGYVVEMKDARDNEWITCTPSAGVEDTHYTVKRLRENAEYSFRICAMNAAGVGEHVDLPGCVVAAEKVEAPEIELDAALRKIVSVRVCSTLRLFVTIRGRPEPEVKWSKEGNGALSERAQIEVTSSYTIDNLQEGCFYYFRVLAVNEFGTGLPAETTEAVKVCEVPLPPGKITLSDVTCSSARLSWEKPDHDGGSKILSYIVEMQAKGDDTWTKCSESKALDATINGLKKGKEYFFRVCAANEKGRSEPKCLPASVVVKDTSTDPRISLLSNTFSVKAGNDLKIDVPFKGLPSPTAAWKKDGNALKETSRVNVSTSDTSSQIIIKDATRIDVGVYEVTLTNSVGTTSAQIFVNVFERPGPPTDLSVDDVKNSSTCLIFYWMKRCMCYKYSEGHIPCILPEIYIYGCTLILIILDGLKILQK
uniref:Titin n=1 Tax=Amphilophus citrinellus TaxID=61819 RepID=A0A3Q0QSW0_AMPCI